MKLTDAQEMAKKHPTTFYAPSQEELDTIKKGVFCKLCFNDSERMWVRVSSRKGNKLVGKLDNDPIVVDMKLGDKVEFEPRHVYQIMA